MIVWIQHIITTIVCLHFTSLLFSTQQSAIKYRTLIYLTLLLCWTFLFMYCKSVTVYLDIHASLFLHCEVWIHCITFHPRSITHQVVLPALVQLPQLLQDLLHLVLKLLDLVGGALTAGPEAVNVGETGSQGGDLAAELLILGRLLFLLVFGLGSAETLIHFFFWRS